MRALLPLTVFLAASACAPSPKPLGPPTYASTSVSTMSDGTFVIAASVTNIEQPAFHQFLQCVAAHHIVDSGGTHFEGAGSYGVQTSVRSGQVQRTVTRSTEDLRLRAVPVEEAQEPGAEDAAQLLATCEANGIPTDAGST